MSNEYNGWTNYETWRVNLEIFDGFDMDDVLSAYENHTQKHIDNPYDLAEYLKEMADEIVFSECRYDERRPTNLMEDYARAFLSDVDWYQIATHMIEEQTQEGGIL
jgi:hypothetical protein